MLDSTVQVDQFDENTTPSLLIKASYLSVVCTNSNR